MKKLAQFIIHSKAAPIIAALLCICMWGYIHAQDDIHGWSAALSYLQLLTYAVAGFAFIKVNAKFDFNSKHSTLPITMLFMGCAINPLQAWKPGMPLLILMLTAIGIVLHTYRKKQSMGGYFTAFALLGVGSLYVPQLLYLMPALLLCCRLMQSLHLRAMAAALLGLLLPYWIAFCILFLTDNTQHIYPFVESLTHRAAYSPTQLTISLGGAGTITLPTMGLQLLWSMLLIVPAAVTLLYSVNVRVQTRAALFLQCTMVLVLIVAALIIPSLYEPLQPTIMLLSSIIGSTLFIDKKSRGQNIWLVILLVLWLLMAALYPWSNFSTF